MPPLVTDQIFPSLPDFKRALRDWAVERNWTPHILDSDSHRVRAGCRSSPDCPFRIRATYNAKRGNAVVTTLEDRHTCEPFNTNIPRPHQNIKRAETCKLKFLLEAVPKLMTVTLDTHILEIIDGVERRYGQKIPTRQAQKVKSGLTDRVRGPCRHCHQLGHTQRHCPKLKASAPGLPNFSTIQHGPPQSSPQASHDNDDHGTSSDGDGTVPNPVDFASSRHQLDRYNPLFVQTQTNQPMQPTNFGNLHQNGTFEDPNVANRIQRLASQEGPVPEQPAIIQNLRLSVQNGPVSNTATTQTPQETRREAAKLMQQAARLMQEASRLNNEAARLTASVANS